ncbi:jg2688 [Pararge aegeria aegeria]|uniref:Jg2688 protein n=1 Tax=Pararge aegeria aegeria TaxID=348720 RepID=A0A8S4QRW9_9NEOP|nr:jg2688 [Pararge aegeria aegeria]
MPEALNKDESRRVTVTQEPNYTTYVLRETQRASVQQLYRSPRTARASRGVGWPVLIGLGGSALVFTALIVAFLIYHHTT